MSENLFRKSVLPSGVTLLSEAMPERRSIAIGVWVRNGARDEPADLLGISHFIEHMMFKGTERRDARAIAQSLESLGGHLDAFTAREQVCYYARALAEHRPQVMDVLFDLVCHSQFADTEVEREKSVVREEIFSCEDNPDDKVNELLAAQVWGGHSLGRPILGTAETVTGLSPRALRRYFASRYHPSQLVVSAAGALDHDSIAELTEEHCAPPSGEVLPLSDSPHSFAPSVQHHVRADLQQLYLALGTRGVAYNDPDRYPLVVLNTLLGGGMSSRLFQSVREEAGLAYSVYSAPDFHRDAGMLCIQLGVSPERGREALALVRQELEKIRVEGLTEEEIEMGRSQLKGNVVMGQESVSNRMSHLAQEEIYRGRYVTPDEQVARIVEVTRDQVIDVARRVLRPEKFALTALGPAPKGALTEADWAIEAVVSPAA